MMARGATNTDKRIHALDVKAESSSDDGLDIVEATRRNLLKQDKVNAGEIRNFWNCCFGESGT